METIAHPRHFFSNDALETIRSFAGDAETTGKLHPEQLATIYKSNLFKMFVPQDYGGLAFTLPEVLRTEEALAWADGSTAWVATLCSGAGWFVGFLPNALSEKVFADDHACLAGSGAPIGTAEETTGGYRINGEWSYASGAPHATMFTVNCILTKNGVSHIDDNGNPLIRSFIFYAAEVEIIPNWSAMGMVATESHGFRITNLMVPTERSFIIDANHTTINKPVYKFPFLQLAETTLVANYSGLAQRFVDLCDEIVRSRVQQNDALNVLEDARQMLNEVRTRFYAAAETAWTFCKNNQSIPSDIFNRVSETSFQLYKTALVSVHILYPYTGLAGADKTTEINRVWRNIHTASQHSLFASRM